MSVHDSPAAGGRRAAVRDREDVVAAQLESLAAAFDLEPDPDFRSATRARLVAMAAVREPQPVRRPAWRRLLDTRADVAPAPAWRRRLTGGLAAAALAVTAVATLVAVSTDARPGDMLYGLKRGTEQTQLALAGDSRGETLLDFAATRLAELGALRGGDASVAVSTLRTMDQQTTEGAAWLAARAVEVRSEDPVRDLGAWTVEQRAGLAALTLPAGAREAAASSQDLLSRIAARATALGTALGCPTRPATRGSDALGPVPGPCAPAPATGTVQGGGPGAGSGSVTVPTPPVPPTTLPPVTTGGTGGTGSTGGTGGTGSTGGGGTPGGGTGSLLPTLPPTTSPLINIPLPPLGAGAGGSAPSGAGSGSSGSGSSGSGSTGSGSGASTGSGGGLGVCVPPLIRIGTC